MTKRDKISFWKQQLETARTSKAVGRQIIIQATQIESEAKRALETLEANPRLLNQKEVLSDSKALRLMASITR
jgi:hypothetical protein